MSKFIYKIVSKSENNDGEIYIGCTKQPLSVRLSKHKYDYKRYQNGKYNYVSSFVLFSKYGIDNCEIVELEKCEDISKKDLIKLENMYIKDIECVNILGKHL